LQKPCEILSTQTVIFGVAHWTRIAVFSQDGVWSQLTTLPSSPKKR